MPLLWGVGYPPARPPVACCSPTCCCCFCPSLPAAPAASALYCADAALGDERKPGDATVVALARFREANENRFRGRVQNACIRKQHDAVSGCSGIWFFPWGGEWVGVPGAGAEHLHQEAARCSEAGGKCAAGAQRACQAAAAARQIGCGRWQLQRGFRFANFTEPAVARLQRVGGWMGGSRGPGATQLVGCTETGQQLKRKNGTDCRLFE